MTLTGRRQELRGRTDQSICFEKSRQRREKYTDQGRPSTRRSKELQRLGLLSPSLFTKLYTEAEKWLCTVKTPKTAPHKDYCATRLNTRTRGDWAGKSTFQSFTAYTSPNFVNFVNHYKYRVGNKRRPGLDSNRGPQTASTRPALLYNSMEQL